MYTDVNCEGRLLGVNTHRCKQLADQVKIELLASGGISDQQHIADLAEAGVDGGIIGTALYTGALPLKDLFS